MANHKSSLKRIRQTESRRLRNRYYEKTARTAVRRIRKMTDKAEAQAALSKVTALLDKLARKNTIFGCLNSIAHSGFPDGIVL